MPTRILTLFIIWLCGLGFAGGETVITVEKARQMALEFNRQFQTAKRELDRAGGNVISARSGALPQLRFESIYTRNIKKQEMLLSGEFFDEEGFIKVPIGQNNDFSFSLSLTQQIFSGGKVFSAYSIAKIYEDYTREKLREVESDIIFGGEGLFYQAVLAESNLEALRSADEQMTYNLDVVEKYFEQGMVSEYELLRARVEKLNLEPLLVAAESQLNISRKSLKSYVGIPLDEEIRLVADITDTTMTDLPSPDSLVAMAYNIRPEIKQAELQKKGYKKAVRVAKGDWLWPSLNLNTTYNISASSDDYRLTDDELLKSWRASILLTIPIFDGGRTIGEVRKAKTDYYQALLAEEQAYDDIRLEVEGAFDALIQAKRALDLQEETIQQAEEGMRIANLRYQSGVGTQLEVLSAQTALTAARTNLARAVYDFRLAKSALKKATGFDIK
jgi:outer membrane protein TolC